MNGDLAQGFQVGHQVDADAYKLGSWDGKLRHGKNEADDHGTEHAMNLDPTATQQMEELLLQEFPDIFEKEARQAILLASTPVELSAGDIWMDIGAFIKSIPLVLKGSLKLVREDDQGNELLLYYINAGQTCALSLSCCSGHERSSIRAVSEEETLLLAVPVRFMDEWTTEFRSWKHFVLKSYQRRFEELLRTIDNVAFKGLDVRILELLRERVDKQGSRVLHMTHQDLANDLNSSREVISRILKRMEHDGVVKLARQKIELCDQH